MDALTDILRAAAKHPNSRVSKHIHMVEEEPSQKNIVLLLIELADHADYSIDFDICLNYYLELFERLGLDTDLVLNEAGLLLVNSSKIYSKRVDFVQSIVERQILTLSNADDEVQKQKLGEQPETASSVEKPRRGRKRAVEASSDSYGVGMVPKKFKKLTEEKRFGLPKTLPKAKSKLRNIEMEQYIHPACWQYATINDFENEEDIDTKRNYKLFTYHVEHRYNTLVPDINFRLHFKVKDYIDEQEEMEEQRVSSINNHWPPLSQAYIDKYLLLENYVLQRDIRANTTSANATAINTDHDLSSSNINESVGYKNDTLLKLNFNDLTGSYDSGLGQSILTDTNNTSDHDQIDWSTTTEKNNLCRNRHEYELEHDSALGTSVLDQSGNTENNTSKNTTANEENLNDLNLIEDKNSSNVTKSQNDTNSSLGTSVLDQSSYVDSDTTEQNLNSTVESNETLNTSAYQTDNDLTLETSSSTQNDVSVGRLQSTSSEYLNKIEEESGKNLNDDVNQEQNKEAKKIRLHLPNKDDEGVYLSDLEEPASRLLSPVLNMKGVLDGVKRKNIKIVMDEELRQALEMRDGIMKHFGHETFAVPVITEQTKQNLIFNILNLPEKLLRRKVLFKLGSDMDLYIQARSAKRSKPECVTLSTCDNSLLQWFSLSKADMAGVYMTPPYSPGHCSDFCGFPDQQDDNISCVDFCGFTEEEQSTLTLKALNRLSRDSGVGVDLNHLAPDKESLEIKLDNRENVSLANYKEILNSVGAGSVENILKELPPEIRDILTSELKENNYVTDENQISLAQTNNEQLIESTETKKSEITMEKSTSKQIENSLETQTCMDQRDEHGEHLNTAEFRNKLAVSEVSTKITELQNISDEIAAETSNKSSEEVINEELTSNFEAADDEDDDYIAFDLNATNTKNKIQRWHEYLQPILAKSRERHHFDVYELGTEIIETMQSKGTSNNEPMHEFKSVSLSSSKPVASFNDIMIGKDESYVSRYFLSTLLLANQSNIEISIQNKSSETPSSWHDISLNLLSTKRHTVALEDNIGMINTKQIGKEQHMKQRGNVVQSNSPSDIDPCEEDSDDDNLTKCQSANESVRKVKTNLKRNSNSTTTAYTSNKKPKVTLCLSREHKDSSNMIENIQITSPPFGSDTCVNPGTIPQTQKIDTSLFNVNINVIRTLQCVEKVQKNYDDIDSGIFSADEISMS